MEKERVEYQRAYYLKNKDKRKMQTKEWKNKNPGKYRANQKRWGQAVKDRIYDKLGGRCAKCHITDRRVLCIDHINGGGNKDRKGMSKSTYYTKVLRDTTSAYQVLCHNCNWIKRHENNEQY